MRNLARKSVDKNTKRFAVDRIRCCLQQVATPAVCTVHRAHSILGIYGRVLIIMILSTAMVVARTILFQILGIPKIGFYERNVYFVRSTLHALSMLCTP